MGSPVTYHQKLVFCGKEKQCRKCLVGIGHGPYWYAYQTIDGRTVQTYIGKDLPTGVEVQTTHSADTAYIRLFTLGQVRLEVRARGGSGAWYPVANTIWEEPCGTLLGALASSPGRTLTIEQADELLGSENVEPAIERLRQVLEPTPRTLRHHTLAAHLVYISTQIRLAEQTRIWIDADAFEHVLQQALGAGDTVREQLLEQAMALYGGDFWPHARQAAWCQARRDALQHSWVGLLLELADLRIARKALPSAIDTLDRLLAIDPTNEAAVRHLITILTWLGRRGEALRAYKRLVTLLEREYGAAPAEETRRLYEDVLQGKTLVLLPRGAGMAAMPARQMLVEMVEVAQIGRASQSPLVGREQIKERLHALLLEAEAQTRKNEQKHSSRFAIPHSVFLLGEPGIGKTRLAEEMGREAKRRGWIVAWSQAYAQESGFPYCLWAEVLRKALLQSAWQNHEERHHLPLYQPLAVLLPELRVGALDLPPSPTTTPEQEQFKLWEAVRALLASLSEGTPVLIVLDDLQWSDSSSCTLLAYLARHLFAHPILLLGTCRADELGVDHPLRSLLTSLQHEGTAETIPLERLSDEQISDLVARIDPTSPPPEAVVQHIREQAAGNPFFAEELLRTHTTVPSSLPASITAVLEHRLGHLTSECLQLLGRAAVLGSSFTFQAIQAMALPTATRGEGAEDTVLDLLEEALGAGILSEEGAGTRITYRFWHPLLVSHLYNRLSATRRINLHRRAAEVLELLYQGREGEGAAGITYHLVQAGAEPSQIAHYAELAGDYAYALSAYPEARKHYRLALEHREPHAPHDRPDERLRLASLLERLAECTTIEGDFEQARQCYEQVLEYRRVATDSAMSSEAQQEAQFHAIVWSEIGWTWRYMSKDTLAWQCCERGVQALQEAGVEVGPAWASLRYLQSSLHWKNGRYDEAERVAREALGLFEQPQGQATRPSSASPATRIQRTLAGDPVNRGRIYRLLAALAATTGKLQEALDYLNNALVIFEQEDQQREIAIVCANLGDLYLRMAKHSQAEAALRRALGIFEKMGDRANMSVSFGNLGILAARSGDLLKAESQYQRALPLAEQINDPSYICLWHGYLAAVLRDQGKLQEAAGVLHRALSVGRAAQLTDCSGFALVMLGSLRLAQALEQAPALGWRRQLEHARSALKHALAMEGLEAETGIEAQAMLAQVALLQGNLEDAHQQATHALNEARASESAWLVARACSLRGNILATQGQHEQAERYFSQALQTFRERGMRLEYARTLFSYGVMLRQQDDQRELYVLQEACQIFRECHANLDLQLAERLLSAREA